MGKVLIKGIKKRTAWWGEEVRNSVKIKMKLFRRWFKTRTQEDRLEYMVTRNEAQRVIRKAKEESWRKIGEDLEVDTSGTKKLRYSLAKNYREKKNPASYAVKDKNNQYFTRKYFE